MTLYEGEVPIDRASVSRLISAQFPAYSELPLEFVRSTGRVNVIYRLGDELSVRLPRVAAWACDLEKELQWLPRLAPRLSLAIPEMVARGQAAEHYPFTWAIYRWIAGDAAHAAWDRAVKSTAVGRRAALEPYRSAASQRARGNGRLRAVIDFGGLGVGNPAADLVAAWATFERAG